MKKRALVTGGSGDIGAAICRRLAADGMHVVVHAHNHPERAGSVIEEIDKAGGSAELTIFDVTDADAVAKKLNGLLDDAPIQVLVNNAGIYDDATMAGMGAEQWRRVIDVNLHGFF